jgi:esterase/lipase
MFESKKLIITNRKGVELEGVLETPLNEINSYALYAHCFTCSKEIATAVRVSRALATKNIATLRFDFSGISSNGGKFVNTTFSSDIEDIYDAADFLRSNYQAPKLLVGHSLGGAAVLGAAGDIDEAKAIATIGAPSDPQHVQHLFKNSLYKIKTTGEADITLGGRKITIYQEFVEDIAQYDLKEKVKNIKKALLILHSPTDSIVEIENAQELYMSAKHPKSFISLDDADHLLSKKEDAEYAAELIAAWSERYIGKDI